VEKLSKYEREYGRAGKKGSKQRSAITLDGAVEVRSLRRV
jgi:hypothetical protein